MKKINFLVKLKKKEEIKLVEPSEDIKNSYLLRSNKSLGSARALKEINNLEDSVSMAYYSMYYSLLALLFRVGIKCENHTAAIMLLKEVFEQENDKISYAKKERIDKQYYVDFSITEEDVEEMIREAESFNRNLFNFIDKIGFGEIEKFRQAFLEVTGN